MLDQKDILVVASHPWIYLAQFWQTQDFEPVQQQHESDSNMTLHKHGVWEE